MNRDLEISRFENGRGLECETACTKWDQCKCLEIFYGKLRHGKSAAIPAHVPHGRRQEEMPGYIEGVIAKTILEI